MNVVRSGMFFSLCCRVSFRGRTRRRRQSSSNPSEMRIEWGGSARRGDRRRRRGVASVQFYKGQALVETDTSAPFAATYDFNADSPDTDYCIKVTASDGAGNQATAEITVNKPKHDFRPPGCTLADNGAFFKVWAPSAESGRGRRFQHVESDRQPALERERLVVRF